MMKLTTKLALILISISFNLHAKEIPVKVGSETVIIQITGTPGKNFVHLHQNETTALQAAKAVARQQGGTVLTLKHSGQRTIVFYLNNQRYEFDPNRIFSDRGIKNTLNLYSHYSPEAARETKKLAKAILASIPEGKIIAVHNNRDYSIKSYFPDQPMRSDISAINLAPKRFHRNFFYVTRCQDYLRLQKKGFNEVLQSKLVKDDGSLSVYMANKRYVNVEAGYEELREQIRMLKNA